MICIYCGCDTRVVNSRLQKRSNQVWRRRSCKRCGAVFTTHEAIDLSSTLLVVVGGVPKPFVADMLFTELLMAMSHRKNSYLDAREATSTVIKKLLELPGKPLYLPSQISLVASEVLKKLDWRAHLRYTAEHPSIGDRM
jgi:transcriptional repressor NrdR